MDCNFSVDFRRVGTTVRIEEQEILQSDPFRYPGSIISQDGEVVEDIEHRIRARRFKCRLASEVFCDRCMYGAECWPIKKQHMHKMNLVEMRMLR